MGNPPTPSKDLIEFTPPVQRASSSKLSDSNLAPEIRVARIHQNSQEDFLLSHSSSKGSIMSKDTIDCTRFSNAQIDDTRWFQPSIIPSPFARQTPVSTLDPDVISSVKSNTNPFRAPSFIEIPSSQGASNQLDRSSITKQIPIFVTHF